jgi:hypothetical protein
MLLTGFLEIGDAQEAFRPFKSAGDTADFGFVRDFSVRVSDINGDDYAQPWVGGLNACQLSTVDTDMDGILDLVVFDRHGNRILPFIYEGPPGTMNYRYAPEYRFRFPPAREWMNLVDYNCDGKNDLFTYTTGGIRIFRNCSDTALAFELEVSLLESYYFNGYVNLFALTDDYPAFTDVDGDGDLDILNFFTLGKYLNYHRNLSMEKYGNCDSLDFRLSELCWGYFEENEFSNVLILNIECDFRQEAYPAGSYGGRHAGSTLLAQDMDADGDKDLIIGDVDYATLIGLVNGGTLDSAHMVSQDTLFPAYDVPVNLMSMPVCGYLDLDHDGVKEMTISPFDPGLDRSENLNSLWFYENLGSDDAPVLSFQTDRFLQDQMIDVGGGSYPVIADLDQDGLEDLIIGNFGIVDSAYYKLGYLYVDYKSQIALFKNIGNQGNPHFKLVDNDLADISELDLVGAYPAFADLDGDGDIDMLVGNSEGTLVHFENTAPPGEMPLFKAPVAGYQGIDVGGYSTPQLIDLDRDTRTDLVTGKMNGTLSYYRNTGTATLPEFTFVTDLLGGVDVTNTDLSLDGYSTPCIFESDDEYRLFVGSEFGQIFYYKDMEGNLSGEFNLVTDNLLYIDEGSRIGVATWNYNADPYLDMIIGNFSGGVSHFRGVSPLPLIHQDGLSKDRHIKVYPNPATGEFRIELQQQEWHRGTSLRILDLYGREFFTGDFTASRIIVISLSGWAKGMYVVEVNLSNGFRYTDKLMVF